MKRSIPIVLLVCLILTACASSPAAPAASEDIAPMAEKEQGAVEPAETDYFTFSDPKIVPSKKEGQYLLDFKFTCLYPETSGEPYPTLVDLRYTFLDEDHVAVKSGILQVQNLFYDETAWASGGELFDVSTRQITQDELADLKYVRFTGCMVAAPLEDGFNYHVEEYTFKTRQEFPLSDLEGLETAFGQSAGAGHEYTEEDIDRALLGTWVLPGNEESEFLFADGIVLIKAGFSGTYTIDLENSVIHIQLSVSNGTVNAKIPFLYRDGVLTLMNEEQKEFVKTSGSGQSE